MRRTATAQSVAGRPARPRDLVQRALVGFPNHQGGTEAIRLDRKKGVRSFCSRCGTQLTFQHADFPDEIDVTTSSLDAPELVPPRDHTRTSPRLRWIAADGLPEYAVAREQE